MLQFFRRFQIPKGTQIELLILKFGDFAEWVGFAYWWSFIGKGLRLQPAQQACFRSNGNVKLGIGMYTQAGVLILTHLQHVNMMTFAVH